MFCKDFVEFYPNSTLKSFTMKCSKSYWKSQFHIFVATSIPFSGISILKLGIKDLFEGAYESLEKPKWAPDFWVK